MKCFSFRKGGAILSALIAVSLLSSCASKVTEPSAPLWADSSTLDQAFPPADFLARTGTSNMPESARMRADTELASYFSTKVESSVSADEQYTSSSDGSMKSRRNLERSMDISSSAEFVALRHTDAYFDKTRGQYVVCAYIDRNEAWGMLEPKLSAAALDMEERWNTSRDEVEPFRRLLLLNSLVLRSDDFYPLYYTALGISRDNAKKYAGSDSLVRKAASERVRLGQSIRISVRASGDDSGRVRTKLGEVLSKDGFFVTEGKGDYIADVAVSLDISDGTKLFTVNPSVSVVIKTASGTEIAAWRKNARRAMSYAREPAVKNAITKIEQEIDGSFRSECLGE